MLRFEKVSYHVQDDGVDIIKEVDLTLESSSIYAITGPNGGGKSSIAKLIMGIYKPTSGRIWFDGRDITQLGITERARLKIGYALQNPPRFKGLTVKRLLELAAHGSSCPVDVCQLLVDVGLCPQDYLTREVNSNLSGGEMKRIEIATVLARDLKLAVFDEPEAGIDLWSFQKLADTFKEIHEKYDTTIVIISHQERILSLADEVIVVAGGSVIEKTGDRKRLSDIIGDLDCICREKCGKGAADYAQCN